MFSTSNSLVFSLFTLIAFVISSRFFWRLLQRAEGLTMAARIEIFAKGITTLAGIVAGLFAFIRYIDQRDLELETRKMEFAQTVREFNLRIYAESKSQAEATRIFLNEVSDLAATLATLDDLKSPTATIALDRFERLYHGQLVLYENEAVSDAMIDFRDGLRKWQRTGTKPNKLTGADRTNSSEGLVIDKQNSDFMRRLSLRLARACNELLIQMPNATSNAKA